LIALYTYSWKSFIHKKPAKAATKRAPALPARGTKTATPTKTSLVKFTATQTITAHLLRAAMAPESHVFGIVCRTRPPGAV
jgi:hypothetical protein